MMTESKFNSYVRTGGIKPKKTNRFSTWPSNINSMCKRIISGQAFMTSNCKKKKWIYTINRIMRGLSA